MNSLYRENYMVNDVGKEITDHVETFINDLMVEYPNVNLIELQNLVNHVVNAEITTAKYTYSASLRKKK